MYDEEAYGHVFEIGPLNDLDVAGQGLFSEFKHPQEEEGADH